MKQSVVTLLITAVLTGCANQPTDPNAKTDAEIAISFVQDAQVEPVKRISTFRTGSWDILDSKTLIYNASRKESYVIELRNTCTGLGKMYDTVGINRTSSSVLTDADSLFSPDFPKMKCFIKNMYPLTEEQVAQLTQQLEDN